MTHMSLNMMGDANQTKNYFRRILQPYELQQLTKLAFLQIKCTAKCYLATVNNCFYGLKNVKVLDFSNTLFSSIYDLITRTYGYDTLPQLSELYLANLTFPDGLTHLIDISHIYNAMIYKPLRFLDVSSNNLYPSSIRIIRKLPYLETFNISKTGRAVFKLTVANGFTNLQVLDASYPYFPSSQIDCKADSIYSWFCNNKDQSNFYLPNHLRELYVKNLFKSTIQLRGTLNTNGLCIKNTFFDQKVNICIGGNFGHLQKLVISENSITYIQSSLVYPFKRLRYLDIARNKLGQALSNESYANSLFNALRHIDVLIMSNNNITGIPNNIFNNYYNLRILDLSHNQLRNTDFGLQYLTSLEYVDLRFNNIISIDASSCNTLKTLEFRKNETIKSNITQRKAEMKINFQNNPFSCSCDNVCFLEYLSELNETNMCLFNDKLVIINDVNIRKAKLTCYENIVIIVFSLLAMSTIILIAITVFFAIKEHRNVKLKRLKETGIEMYGKLCKKHVVFLSFSGEDTEFVMTKVYPKLESGLKRILNTGSQCVATGGTSFKPGYSISDEIVRCIEDSSVVIFFLSDTFIQKPWCRSEVHKAFCDEKPIILMMSGKINTALMPTALHKHYETFTRVHWTMEHGEPVMRPDWDHLCETIVGLIGTIG